MLDYRVCSACRMAVWKSHFPSPESLRLDEKTSMTYGWGCPAKASLNADRDVIYHYSDPPKGCKNLMEHGVATALSEDKDA